MPAALDRPRVRPRVGVRTPPEGTSSIIANGMEILGFAPGQMSRAKRSLSQIAEILGSPLRIVGEGRSSLIFIPILIPAELAFRKLVRSHAQQSSHFQGLVYTKGSFASHDSVKWNPSCGRNRLVALVFGFTQAMALEWRQRGGNQGLIAVFLIPGTFLTTRYPDNPGPRSSETRDEFVLLGLTARHELVLATGRGDPSIYGGLLDVVFHEFWTGAGGSGPTF